MDIHLSVLSCYVAAKVIENFASKFVVFSFQPTDIQIKEGKKTHQSETYMILIVM